MKKLITILIITTSFLGYSQITRDKDFTKKYSFNDTLRCFKSTFFYKTPDITSNHIVDTSDYCLFIKKYDDGYYYVRVGENYGYVFIGSLLDYWDINYNNLTTTLHIGMGEVMLIKLMGKPNSINITNVGNIIKEQWVYDKTFVYLENKVVYAFQITK